MYVTSPSDPNGLSTIFSDPNGLSTFVDDDIYLLNNSWPRTTDNVKKVDTTVSGNKAITVNFIARDAAVEGYSPAHQKTYVQHAGKIYVFDDVPDNPTSDAIYRGDIEKMMESVMYDSSIPENSAASGQTISEY